MFQGSVEFGPFEQRRRRRYSFSSRTSLAAVLGMVEGLVAGLLLLVALLLIVPAPEPAINAVMLECLLVAFILGTISFNQARRALAAPDVPQYPVAQALVASIVSLAVAGLVTAGSGVGHPGIAEIGWGGLGSAALVLVGLRLSVSRVIKQMLSRGRLQVERLALIGTPEAILRFEQETPPWQRGAQVIARRAIVSSQLTLNGQDSLSEFVASCLAKRCDFLLFVGDMHDMALIGDIEAACEHYALNVLFAPIPSRMAQGHRFFDVLPFGPSNSVRVIRPPLDDRERFLKRLFDVSLALVLLVVLAPILLVIATLLRLSGPGPVLYRQERRGFNGESFHILKFRTMWVMEDGRSMKPVVANDPRITRIGRFLRRTSIDELPQLINVLRGEMSLVGPRPHGISHDAELSRRFDLYARRQRITPGITGWAQVNGHRGDVSTQQRIEGRTLHDLYYVENWSMAFDFWILFLTVFSARTRSHAE